MKATQTISTLIFHELNALGAELGSASISVMDSLFEQHAEALMRGLAAELGYTPIKLDADLENRLINAVASNTPFRKVMQILKGGDK